MTVAELYQWAAIRHWGNRRIHDMEQTLKKYVIFPIDLDLCRLWGYVRAKCRVAGQPISPQDAWIAATALHYHLPLVTHNPADSEIVEGLDVFTIVRETGSSEEEPT
jgi:tRNA(fMet)-specific endonuclease VapC